VPAPTARAPAAASDPIERVTTLELFFDLVFVFTITQLTVVLVEEATWTSLWHVGVMLALIFWMYDGYAWLTNAVPARGPRRQVLLLGGMAGYLVVSIAIPGAFDGDGLTFGLALLVITAIHAWLFLRSAGEGSSAAMRRLAPMNLAAALAVVAAGAVGGDVQAVAWTAVALLEWFAFRVEAGFELGPAHFVERHGLLVIVAIGESVVAIGIGAGSRSVDAGLVAIVTLGLALCAGLWWTYFGGDEEVAAERAMTAVQGPERARMALAGYGYAHYGVLLGVILTAVGIEAAVAHPSEHLHTAQALALCGGVALFLGADAWFRSVLGLGRGARRLVAALAVLLAVPVGTTASAAAGLAATTLLLTGALALEGRSPAAA
jgi:low temperature requirement protein LtrA